jgi:hypothetical protein
MASVGARVAGVGLLMVAVLGGGGKLSSGELQQGSAMGPGLGSFNGTRGTYPGG